MVYDTSAGCQVLCSFENLDGGVGEQLELLLWPTTAIPASLATTQLTASLEVCRQHLLLLVANLRSYGLLYVLLGWHW